MHMNHIAFTSSPALRTSLKRGLARQAFVTAAQADANIPALFHMAAKLRPNAKSADRVAARIKAQRGVVRVTLNADHKGITFIARVAREVESRVEGETAFEETGLIYLQVRVGFGGGPGVGFQLSAVSFCRHAVERLVERSAIPLEVGLLLHIDAEALALFRSWDRTALIADAGDEFYPAAASGLWAGGHDEMTVGADWGLSNVGGRLPLFSVRTFLSETEMRPTVWLRWNNDPHCRMT